MLAFQESSDLEPLSFDINYHMQLTNSSKYALIIDAMSAKLLIQADSSYAIAKESFFPLYYSVALQKNSAYTDEINEA